MSHIPQHTGLIHFIGIGGIGMSGIAEVLHNLGYKVQGSDLSDNPNVQRLSKIGIKTFIGHDAKHVHKADAVVISSDIPAKNPELQEARQKLIPVVRRAEMLGELMRFKSSVAVAGTHGKTTTTSLVAHLFDTAGLDPTVINGGIINTYNTNAHVGDGDWMVVEADESDGSFLKLPATVGIVTNIDPEHLSYYGDFDRLKLAFENFILNLPFYGYGVLCIDHPTVQALIPHVTERRIITYGTNPQANVRATHVELRNDGAHYNVEIKTRKMSQARIIEGLHLPMMGNHNVLNSLAAITIGHEMGFDDATIIKAIGSFKGVKRRFTKTGEVDGITFIDDYGHHPVEIEAVLKAGRQASPGRVIAVFQPHRYTRVADLFEEFCHAFNDADSVIVTDIYSAREEPIEGISKESLVEGLRLHGHRHVIALDTRDDLPTLIQQNAKSDDYVICLGAGDITKWAHELPDEVAHLKGIKSKKEAHH